MAHSTHTIADTLLACMAMFCAGGFGASGLGCSGSPDSAVVAVSGRAEEIRGRFKAELSAEPDSLESEPEGEPSGFANLVGTVKVVGEVPARRVLIKVGETCTVGGDRSVVDQSIMVDPVSGGLKWAAIYALEIPANRCHSSAKPGVVTDEASYELSNCQFSAHVHAMRTSQLLRIKNLDLCGHNPNFQPRNTRPPSSLPNAAEYTYSHKAEENEPYSVSCDVHYWMKAFILPRDNGYFAVTRDDGEFQIDNLPAGVKLKLRFWHEKMTPKSIKINGEEVKLDRGVFTLKLADNETKKLEIEISASDIKK